LKNQTTLAIRKKGTNPGAEVARDSSGAKEGDQGGGGDIIKPPFYVEEEGGGFKTRALNRPDLMSEGSTGIKSAKARERTTLVAIEESR